MWKCCKHVNSSGSLKRSKNAVYVNQPFPNYSSLCVHLTRKSLVGFGILSRFCWWEQGLRLVQQKSPLGEESSPKKGKVSLMRKKSSWYIFLKAPFSSNQKFKTIERTESSDFWKIFLARVSFYWSHKNKSEIFDNVDCRSIAWLFFCCILEDNLNQ